ncbi:hypothetical protein NKDENANG_03613 [Candidatus Entotheonellaceae bacterium PAL068K]
MKDYMNVRTSDLVEVLKILETLVVSLDRLGSHYHDMDHGAFERVVTEFIKDWEVSRNLVVARRLLSEYFDDTLGEDDQDELERAMCDPPHWEFDQRKPPKRS